MKYYFKSHEWIEEVGENTYRMGVSSYAADQLGDIVFVEPKDDDEEFEKGNSVAILESVKAVGDVYAPFNCKVKQSNSDLVDSPESINANAEDAWVVEIEASEAIKLESLEGIMPKEDYESSYLASL